MKNCLNCYNSLMCYKFNHEKWKKYKELGEGCPQWEDDQEDFDDEE